MSYEKSKLKTPIQHRAPPYDTLIKITGNTAEVVAYPHLIKRGYQRPHAVERRGESEMANEHNTKRARRNCIDIVNTNMTAHTKMVTLTYAENMTDYDRLNRDLETFHLYIRRKGYRFPWLLVVEQQKRGAYHAHIIAFTDVYIPKDIIDKAWRHGATNIEALRNKDNAGAYVAKYLTKENKPAEKKAYRTSQDIKKPTVARTVGGGEDVAQYLQGEGYEFRGIVYFTMKGQDEQAEDATASVLRLRKPLAEGGRRK